MNSYEDWQELEWMDCNWSIGFRRECEYFIPVTQLSSGENSDVFLVVRGHECSPEMIERTAKFIWEKSLKS